MRLVRNWIPFIGYCFLVTAIILILPERIYFSKSTNRVEADTLVLTLIFVIPLVFVPFIFPKRFFRFYVGFITFGFVGYLTTNFYRQEKVKRELLSNSISINGVVKDKRYFKAGKGVGHWEFICEFQVNNILYKTFYQKDLKDKIDNGDTLRIIFLERNPEISKIMLPKDY